MDCAKVSDYMLCGDIGGTNSRLKLFSVPRGEAPHGGQVPGELVHGKEFQNEFYKTFTDVCTAFIQECETEFKCNFSEMPIKVGNFAVAGPVDSNRVAFTNRSDWVVDGADLAAALNIQSVNLINDFVANGYGLLALGEKDTVTLQEGTKKPNGVVAMLGAGTGLGECFLTCSSHAPGLYDCFPSEGGHSEFAPRTDLEIELLQYLKNKFGENARISYERIVSGKGIGNVYDFMRQRFPKKIDPELDAKIMSAGDQMGGVVAMNQHSDTLCKWCMEVFYSSYGAEAGSVALKFLPFGGLYIAGGIAPKNLEALMAERKFHGFDIGFKAALLDKGRVSPMLKQIPIKIVLAEDLGQRGSKYLAFRTLRKLLVDEGLLLVM
uniref:Glucokinase n=1 Tax=Tetraselmis chuii TaxID=63592 RepID=A0A7S1SRA5_9CHLO|mmetsp:Transcript_23891/g.42516  ORF Transcript_23891/g.42516 Transcript_23891/m.42516 type:complete len:379 (+) Transcript_23891:93-1229(+)|eukprot:CAMPEP_0177777284 /NCGR_PEP_ID=MMETSP0491_2-20121128/15257_1 /TAXON_ID=63592 /ORGANISM="Tetraselmis chuii, Strain PLY429" /LENGTH=378 /DNA_ID=CAMNT_0019296317 /DNA_START=112 /DNA_END=1248 /DNA_ORIENTATION=+